MALRSSLNQTDRRVNTALHIQTDHSTNKYYTWNLHFWMLVNLDRPGFQFLWQTGHFIHKEMSADSCCLSGGAHRSNQACTSRLWSLFSQRVEDSLHHSEKWRYRITLPSGLEQNGVQLLCCCHASLCGLVQNITYMKYGRQWFAAVILNVRGSCGARWGCNLAFTSIYWPINKMLVSLPQVRLCWCLHVMELFSSVSFCHVASYCLCISLSF